MKFYLKYCFALIAIFSCNLAVADEFRGSHEYSPSDLNTFGEEWLTFCNKEKELLSKYSYKFKKFLTRELGKNAEKPFEKVRKIESGGIVIPLMFGNQLIEFDSQVDSFTLKVGTREAWMGIFKSPRSLIKNLWAGVASKELLGAKTTKLIFPNGVSDHQMIMRSFSTTPEDISCVPATELEDKALFFFLGLKAFSNDRVLLKSEIGFIEVVESTNSTMVNIFFESNNYHYQISYYLRNKTDFDMDMVVAFFASQ